MSGEDLLLANYYLLNWQPRIRLRMDVSKFKEVMLEWCYRRCKGKYTWEFVRSSKRRDHPFDDAVDFRFEVITDSTKFMKEFPVVVDVKTIVSTGSLVWNR